MKHHRSAFPLSLGLAVILILSLLLCTAPRVRSAGTIFVDASADGPIYDGTSWDRAYITLQTALAVAVSGDQIWVAQGRYTPGPAGSPTSTFTIRDGVQVYGGFAGGETALSQRDPDVHATVLSGDLDDNDAVDGRGVTLTAGDIAGTNAYHVVTVNGVSSATVLDGVIITGGDARPVVSRGGAITSTSSNAQIQQSVLIGNAADRGGAVYVDGGSPRFVQVTLEANTALGNGGAVCLINAIPEMIGASFVDNSATSGGAVVTYGTSALAITNAEFLGNTASSLGGAVYVYSGSVQLTNVTVAANTAAEGGATYSASSTVITFANDIVWGNSAPVSPQIGGNSLGVVSYSLIQGGYSGTGNLDLDPLFVDLAAGDLRLSEGSPAIDAGDDTAVPVGVTTDLAGANRFIDGDGDSVPTVDMGAYEYGVGAGTATLTVGTESGVVGGAELRVPITIDLESSAALLGADLVLSYDAARLTALRVETGAQTAGWSMAYNVSTSGQVRFSMAHSGQLVTDGELAVMVFSPLASGSAAIGWVSASLNEGDIAATLVGGAANLYAATVADFSATPTTGVAPLSVAFTSLAAGAYDTVEWRFGDGATSTETNPTHVYDTPGVYDVSLSISGPGGTDGETKCDYITVYTPAQAAFSATPVDGLAPLEVQFTDQSTGDISSYAWDFGDGGASALQNPTHVYSTAGTYDVSLVVSGNGGTSTETKTALVTAGLGTITGAVRFWNDARPVPGASLVLSGDAEQTAYSLADGTYSLAGLERGSYTVVPGDGADDGDAISAYDASLVLQHAAGLRTLADQAFTAGDVTLNGAPTAYDAAFILRKAADLIPLASPDAGVAWLFEPASRQYPDYAQSVAAQDYTALLLGDVSGNWGDGVEPAALAVVPVAELELVIGVPDATGAVQAMLMLIATEAPMYSLALDLGCEGLVPVDVRVGDISTGWLLAHNADVPGHLTMAMAGAQPAVAPGVLAYLTLTTTGSGDGLSLEPLSADIDEDALQVHWHGQPAKYYVYLPLLSR